MDKTHNVKEDSFKITRNWSNQSKRLKEEFPQLTDRDLKFEEGQEEELLERIEIRLNKETNEVINIIKKVQLEKS